MTSSNIYKESTFSFIYFLSTFDYACFVFLDEMVLFFSVR